MELAVLNKEGNETGRKVQLSDGIFGIQPSEHAIYLDVKQYLANQRQGTHKAKERAEIARTTKKAYRQKGTGNARQGSLKSPLHRGGGTVFGPRMRDYSFKLNKKLKRLARKSALSLKVANQEVLVLEDLRFEAPKTKDFAGIVRALKADGKKSLVVLAENDKNVYLSSRNLQGSGVVTASELNTYQIMNTHRLILTEGSIAQIENILS